MRLQKNKPGAHSDSVETAQGDDSPAAILEKQIAQSMPNMDVGLRKSKARYSMDALTV